MTEAGRPPASLGGRLLPVHDPDAEGTDHRVLPGHWQVATCQESGLAHRDMLERLDLNVWAGLTRMGETLFRIWGSADGTTPYVADLREWTNGPGEPTACFHAIYVVEITPRKSEAEIAVAQPDAVAPAEPMCVCGHPRTDHVSDPLDHSNECVHLFTPTRPCMCSEFRFRTT